MEPAPVDPAAAAATAAAATTAAVPVAPAVPAAVAGADGAQPTVSPGTHSDAASLLMGIAGDGTAPSGVDALRGAMGLMPPKSSPLNPDSAAVVEAVAAATAAVAPAAPAAPVEDPGLAEAELHASMAEGSAALPPAEGADAAGMPPIATTVLSHPGLTTATPVSAQLMAQVTQEQLAAAYAAYGMQPPTGNAALQALMVGSAAGVPPFAHAVVPAMGMAAPPAPAPGDKMISTRRSGTVTKQGWSREEDELIMEAYNLKGARPPPLPLCHPLPPLCVQLPCLF